MFRLSIDPQRNLEECFYVCVNVEIFEEGERKKEADQSDDECSKRCGRFVCVFIHILDEYF